TPSVVHAFPTRRSSDLGALKKFAESVMDKISKGTSLNASEVEFVSKGGLNFLNKKEDDKDDKKEDDKVSKAGHPDEKEDKPCLRSEEHTSELQSRENLV